MHKIAGFAAVIMILLPASVSAGAWSPVQVALWHPAQVVPSDWNVYGLRLNLIYGKNSRVWGLDLGFANTGQEGVCGIQAGLINGPGRFGGIGVGGINSAEHVNGIQAGLLSISQEETNGAQVSAIYNKSRRMRGLQFGLINSADTLKGLQIGLINTVKNGPIRFLPILNPGF